MRQLICCFLFLSLFLFAFYLYFVRFGSFFVGLYGEMAFVFDPKQKGMPNDMLLNGEKLELEFKSIIV